MLELCYNDDMKILFWAAYILTVAEFLASPINVLRNSAMHIKRFEAVKFPLKLAKSLAVVELVAVAAVIVGIWVPITRQVGGVILAAAFLPLLIWAARAKRPAGDLLGLAFFMACSLVVALY